MRIGIDLGGTKIEGIALADNGDELYRQRIASPADSYQAILLAIQSLVSAIELKTNQVGSIGIGTPGAINHQRLIKNSNTLVLNGKPLLDDLQNLLQREIRISNDANCFALSEAIDGAGANYKSVFAVILGTGVGGGIVNHRKIMEGANRIGGEWGHNQMPWMTDAERSGFECYCGKQDCIETFLSGAGLRRIYFNHAKSQKSVEQIIQLTIQGDAHALQVLSYYELHLAKALSQVINIVDPDVIVLGGGLSNITRLYENIPKLWNDTVFSDSVKTKLVPPHFGDSSGVRGAAWSWDA